jgi:hypothetical protein
MAQGQKYRQKHQREHLAPVTENKTSDDDPGIAGSKAKMPATFPYKSVSVIASSDRIIKRR